MKTKQINMRLDVGLISYFEDLAERHDRDRTYFMRKALESYRDSQNSGGASDSSTQEEKPRSNFRNKVAPSNDQDELDRLFESFWLSGIRKIGKKAAKARFNSILKSQADKPAFTNQLINDVKQRLAIGQMGFSEMHPTTYLNGERWNDELRQPQQQAAQQPRTAYERSRAALSEQEARLRIRMEQGGTAGYQALGENGSDVRPQVSEPVRGDGQRDLGEVLEGDYRPAGGEWS